MSILSWMEDQRRSNLLNISNYNNPESGGNSKLWTRCDNCGLILYIKHLQENHRVCFGCGYHLHMTSQERIENLIDFGTWRPLDETLSPCDPLEFRDQKLYTERLKEAQERTGLQDAVQTGTGLLDDIPIALGVMDFHFMGGSMGSVVGEKITRLIEYATQQGLTLILVCASGGARMQEGILSLMQMAKISGALKIYQSCANLLYISVLTSPTTGGVTASFAMLGDLIFSEPKALIGFAGRRVIEQTLQEQLPDDFQTAEYLLHHGLLDLTISRFFFKQALSEIITLYKEAPFKKIGYIPHGMITALTSFTEEKIRRKSMNLSETTNNFNSLNQVSKKEREPLKDMVLEVLPQILYNKGKTFINTETDFTNTLKVVSITSDINTSIPVNFKKMKLEWLSFINKEYKNKANTWLNNWLTQKTTWLNEPINSITGFGGEPSKNGQPSNSGAGFWGEPSKNGQPSKNHKFLNIQKKNLRGFILGPNNSVTSFGGEPSKNGQPSNSSAGFWREPSKNGQPSNSGADFRGESSKNHKFLKVAFFQKIPIEKPRSIALNTFSISIQGDFRFWQDLNSFHQNHLEQTISFANQSVLPWYVRYTNK